MTTLISPKREFFLNSNVTADSIKDIILGIYEINKFDDEQSENKIKYERKPIKLVIDSFGGDCYSGMALVNSMDTSDTPVHTYCYGKAMSMGLTIFSAGHKRFAHELATFMQHQLTSGTRDKLTEMIQSVEEWIRLQEMLDDLLVERTNIEKRRLVELREMKKDWYFTGKEAIRLGVADELIVRKTVA